MRQVAEDEIDSKAKPSASGSAAWKSGDANSSRGLSASASRIAECGELAVRVGKRRKKKKGKKEKSTTLPFLFPFVPHSSYILSYLFFFLPPGIFIRCNFFFHPLLSSSLLLHFSLSFFLPSFLSLFLIRSSRLKRAEPRATHPSPRPSSVTICPAFQPDDAARTIDRNDRV